MTTERTHLSIGEVLSLLQPEFPDITISKIRFLESQGLLDPERTPSGYRKFHDDDIERLRWILTQQRDHFLPLKVIKDRLASGDLGGGTPEGVLPLAADTAEVTDPTTVPAWASTTPASPERHRGARRGVGQRLRPDRSLRPPTPSPHSSLAAARPAPATASGGQGSGRAAAPATRQPSLPTATVPAPRASPPPPLPRCRPPRPRQHDRAEAVGRLVEAPDDARARPGRGARRRGGRRDADGTKRTGPRAVAAIPPATSPGRPTPEPGAEPDPDVVVAVLTIDDLTERSGLSAREISELERYGLIAGETDGQVTTYDEEALVVARLASGFNRYGIEPRHLRMYKVAAEREAGLFEQLISPLLKQRRPSARQQAVEMLEDLAELADDLRAAMVRSALREYLGGS